MVLEELLCQTTNLFAWARCDTSIPRWIAKPKSMAGGGGGEPGWQCWSKEKFRRTNSINDSQLWVANASETLNWRRQCRVTTVLRRLTVDFSLTWVIVLFYKGGRLVTFLLSIFDLSSPAAVKEEYEENTIHDCHNYSSYTRGGSNYIAQKYLPSHQCLSWAT